MRPWRWPTSRRLALSLEKDAKGGPVAVLLLCFVVLFCFLFVASLFVLFVLFPPGNPAETVFFF